MKWTKDRAEELRLLQQLLNDVQTINRGSHVLERLARCIDLAEKLDRHDLENGRPSFMSFLSDLYLDERAKNK